MVRTNTRQDKHYIITGHTVGSVKRNVLDPMEEMFGVDTKLDNSNMFHLFGNKIHVFGADKADSYKAMTGMTAHGWYGNEITLHHENTINEAFNRVSGEEAAILWDTNPDYPEHPIKINYIDRSGERLSTGQLRIQSYHFTIDDNPFLDQSYIENLKASTPPGMWYDRKIKGLWVAAAGLVFEGFDRNVNVIEPFDIPREWRRFRAIDFGYTNPFACLWGALDGDGRLYIYDEHYEAQMLIQQHAQRIHLKSGDERYEFSVADHDKQVRAEFSALAQNKIMTIPAKKNDKAYNIQLVAERLVKQRDGKPRLYFMRNCKKTIWEIGKYRWQEKKEGQPRKEDVVKEDDHAMDALQYLVRQIDNPGMRVSDIPAGRLGL